VHESVTHQSHAEIRMRDDAQPFADKHSCFGQGQEHFDKSHPVVLYQYNSILVKGSIL